MSQYLIFNSSLCFITILFSKECKRLGLYNIWNRAPVVNKNKGDIPYIVSGQQTNILLQNKYVYGA